MIPQGPVAGEAYLNGIGAQRACHHSSGALKVPMYPYLVHILFQIPDILQNELLSPSS